MAREPSFGALKPTISPRNDPMGVRAAPTMTTSRMCHSADESCGLDIPRPPDVSRRCRKVDRERGAAGQGRFDPDRAAVLLHDALADAEPEAGAGLALGREERLPDAAEVLGGD